MARTLDFPASPHIGQLYSNNWKSWRWNGFVWEAYREKSEAEPQGRKELRAWHAALADSANSGARVLIVTDSMGTYSASDPENTTWAALLDKALLNSIGISDAVGYIPVREEAPDGNIPGVIPDTPYPNGLQWDHVGGVNSDTGPGGWGREIDGVGGSEYCGITRSGDGFILHFTKQQTNGAIMTVAVNGSTVTTIDTTDGGLGVDEKSGFYYSYNHGSYGAMAVTVWADSDFPSKTVKVDGIHFTNGNRTSGIRVIKAAHEGWGFTDYCDIVNHKSTLQYIKENKPELIITSLGTNDYFLPAMGVNNWPAGTPERMDFLFNTWVDAVRGQYTPSPADPDQVSLVFVFPPKSGFVPANWSTDYKSTLRLACKEKGVLFLDFDEALGAYTSDPAGDPLNIAHGNTLDDGLHPNDLGHFMMAQPVIEALRINTTATIIAGSGGSSAAEISYDGEGSAYLGASPDVQAAIDGLDEALSNIVLESGTGDLVSDGKVGGQHLYGGPGADDDLLFKANTTELKTMDVLWQNNVLTRLAGDMFATTDSGKSIRNIRNLPSLLVADDWPEGAIFHWTSNTTGTIQHLTRSSTGRCTYTITGTLTRTGGASRPVSFKWTGTSIAAQPGTTFYVDDVGATVDTFTSVVEGEVGVQDAPPSSFVISEHISSTSVKTVTAAPYKKKWGTVDLLHDRGSMFDGVNILGGSEDLRKPLRALTFTSITQGGAPDYLITLVPNASLGHKFYKSDIGMTLHRSGASTMPIPEGSEIISVASDSLSAVARPPTGEAIAAITGTARLGVFTLTPNYKTRASDLFIGHHKVNPTGQYVTDSHMMTPVRISLDYTFDGAPMFQMPNTYVPGPGGLINVDGIIRMGENLTTIDNFSGAFLNSTRNYTNIFEQDTNPGGFLYGIIWSDNFNSSLGKTAIRQLLPYTSNLMVNSSAGGDTLVGQYFGTSNQDFLRVQGGNSTKMGTWTGHWIRPPYITGETDKISLGNVYGIEYGILGYRDVRIIAKRVLSVTRGDSVATYVPDVSDASGYDVLEIGLDGNNLTIDKPAWGATTPTVGQRLVIQLRQKPVGTTINWVGYSVQWDETTGGYNFNGSNALNPDKFSRTGFMFEWDGTNWEHQTDEKSLWEAEHGACVIMARKETTGAVVNAFSQDDLGAKFGDGGTTQSAIPNYPEHTFVASVAPAANILGTTDMVAMHLPYTNKAPIPVIATFARSTMAPYTEMDGESVAARFSGPIDMFPTGNRNINDTAASATLYNASTVLEFGSGSSFGFAPPAFINADGQYRIMHTGAGIMPSFTNWKAKVSFRYGAYSTGSGYVHNVAGEIETDPGAADGLSLGLLGTFRSYNKYTAHGVLNADVSVEDHISHTQFDLSNGSFDTISSIGFVSRSTHDGGALVGSRRAFIAEDTTGTGSYNSQVGFYSEFLTNGFSNYGFFAEPAVPGNTDYKAASFAGTTIDGFGNTRINGTLTVDETTYFSGQIFTEPIAIAVPDNSTLTLIGRYNQLVPSGNITYSSASPVFSEGGAGQRVTISNLSQFTITIPSSLAAQMITSSGNPRILAEHSTMELLWDDDVGSGGSWVEIGGVPYNETIYGKAFKPSGVLGATTASRYAGAIADSFSPTVAINAYTGSVGDWVIDYSNGIWIYTAPNTWANFGGSSVLPTDINVMGRMSYDPGATTTGVTAGTTISNTTSYRKLSSTLSRTFTSSPTIRRVGPDAVIGQTIVIENVNNPATANYNFTFTHDTTTDNTGLGSRLKLKSATRTIAPYESIMFMFDGMYWVEVGGAEDSVAPESNVVVFGATTTNTALTAGGAGVSVNIPIDALHTNGDYVVAEWMVQLAGTTESTGSTLEIRTPNGLLYSSGSITHTPSTGKVRIKATIVRIDDTHIEGWVEAVGSGVTGALKSLDTFTPASVPVDTLAGGTNPLTIKLVGPQAGPPATVTLLTSAMRAYKQ